MQIAIHVWPPGQIVVWSEAQPSVSAHLRYVRRNTKIRTSVGETYTSLLLAVVDCLVLACYGYNRMHLLEQ